MLPPQAIPVPVTLAIWLASAPPAGWLGVVLAARDGRPTIVEVVPGSPAAAAGLLPGDQVMSVGGASSPDLEHAIAAISARRAGERLVLLVRRGSKPVRVEARLMARPD